MADTPQQPEKPASLDDALKGKRVVVEMQTRAGRSNTTQLYWGTYVGLEMYGTQMLGSKLVLVLENAAHYNATGISFGEAGEDNRTRIESKRTLLNMEYFMSIDEVREPKRFEG